MNKRERHGAGGGWAAIRRPGISLSLLRSNEASVQHPVVSLLEPTLGEILPPVPTESSRVGRDEARPTWDLPTP